MSSISEKWDPRPRIFSGTQNPRSGTHLMGKTQDPRPETLKVRPETRDPGHKLWVGPGTLQVGPETRGPGHLFYMKPKIRDSGD